MKKAFILLVVVLHNSIILERVFGEELSNAPANGDKYTCTIKGVAFDMVFVEGGRDTHGVSVSDFWIGKYEVTQEQWMAVMGTTIQQMRTLSPYGSADALAGVGASYPMYFVSWNDAQEFIAKLNAAVGGGKFRLPMEREWEYAARGGSANDGTTYAGSETIDNVAWYLGNSDATAHPVGGKAANGINAHDMSGNVSEWCEEWSEFDAAGVGEFPMPATYPATGVRRIVRGGAWSDAAEFTTVLCRGRVLPHSSYATGGFRLACSSN